MDKLLSKARKKILIRPIAQALPTHTITCLLLPKALCEDLTHLVRNFWQGKKKG